MSERLKKAKSRREIQAALRASMLGVLEGLPEDGRHLGRVCRSLTYLTCELLSAANIPKAASAQLIVEALKRGLRDAPPSEGVFGVTPTAKA